MHIVYMYISKSPGKVCCMTRAKAVLSVLLTLLSGSIFIYSQGLVDKWFLSATCCGLRL